MSMKSQLERNNLASFWPCLAESFSAGTIDPLCVVSKSCHGHGAGETRRQYQVGGRSGQFRSGGSTAPHSCPKGKVATAKGTRCWNLADVLLCGIVLQNSGDPFIEKVISQNEITNHETQIFCGELCAEGLLFTALTNAGRHFCACTHI